MYEGATVEKIGGIRRAFQAKSTLPFYDEDGLPTYLDDKETCAALVAAVGRLSDGVAILIKRHGNNGHIAANKPFGHGLGLQCNDFSAEEFHDNTKRWPAGLWKFLRNFPTVQTAFSDVALATMDYL